MPVNTFQPQRSNSLGEITAAWDLYKKASGTPEKVEVSNPEDFKSTGSIGGKKPLGLDLQDSNPIIDKNNYDPNLTAPINTATPSVAPSASPSPQTSMSDAMQRQLEMQQQQAGQKRNLTAQQKPQQGNGLGDIAGIMAMLA